MELFADPPEQGCGLLRSFFMRLGVLIVAAAAYILYTYIRMKQGVDKRDFGEFVAMFFNLCSHQAVAGLVLLLYSLSQTGLDPLVWFSSTFDFEFLVSMTSVAVLKATLAPWCLQWYQRRTGVQLAMGQVGDERVRFRWDYVYVQFGVSVCVVALLSRMCSLAMLIFLQSSLLPFDAVYLLADFYASLPLTCTGKMVLILYIKPVIVDASTLILSDWLLSSPKAHGHGHSQEMW
jgi:hypothetical protein